MAVIKEGQSVVVHGDKKFLIDRTINTTVVALDTSEVFNLIQALTREASLGGPVYLAVESDKIYAAEPDLI
jgi:hypothetical protein